MRISSIDIGGTYIKSGIFQDRSLVSTNSIPTEATFGTAQIIDKVTAIIKSHGKTDAIAISTRGQVDFSHGVIIYDTPEVIPDYSGTPLKEILAKTFAVPIIIEHDVNCVAIGEGTLGAAKGMDDYLCLTYGTSIGGAIVTDGKLNRGSNHSAGEFGMMLFPDSNATDRFISYENFASVSILIKMARKIDDSLTDGWKIMSRIEEAAISEVVSAWCNRISLGLASLIHIFNPSAIIIGGGFMENEEIIKRIDAGTRNLIAPGFDNVKLLSATLGNTAGMIGAAVLAERELVNSVEIIMENRRPEG